MSRENGWDKLERKTSKGPMSCFFAVLALLVVGGGVLGIVGFVAGWFGEAADVAREEFGPRAALEKYEWFIDTRERVRKLDVDVTNYSNQLETTEKNNLSDYGEDRAKWPFDVRTSFNAERDRIQTDVSAIMAQRNNLAAEYNAASDKFNWKMFKSREDFPGETIGEYKPVHDSE